MHKVGYKKMLSYHARGAQQVDMHVNMDEGEELRTGDEEDARDEEVM